MVDIHCHILPAADDGAEDTDTALDMAFLARDSGITDLIATPHCNVPGFPDNYRSDRLSQRFAELREQIGQAGIDLVLHPGCEVFCDDRFPSLLRAGRFYTLADSRYLLIEFDFEEDPEFMTRCAEAVLAEGLIPVLAHPERYDAVQDDPELIEFLAGKGAVIQINKDSVLGRLGESAEEAALQLLERGLAQVVAGDAHGTLMRTPSLRQIEKVLNSRFGPEVSRLLLTENPGRILRDEPILY